MACVNKYKEEGNKEKCWKNEKNEIIEEKHLDKNVGKVQKFQKKKYKKVSFAFTFYSWGSP